MLAIMLTAMQGQDTTKVKGFDYSKLKPVVHFFANAEYHDNDRLNVIGTGPSNVNVPVSGNAIISGFLVSPIKGITLCLNYQGFFPELSENLSTHRLLFSFEYRI